MKESRNRIFGMGLSYINAVLSIAINIFLTPFIIKNLGKTEYGIYQMIASFASYLVIMNLGIGTVISKYVSLYRARNDKEGEFNFIAMAMMLTGFMVLVISIAGIVLYTQIGNIYQKLSATELEKARSLFILVILNLISTLILQAFQGIVKAYEKFILVNAFITAKYFLKAALLISLLKIGLGSVSIALTDLVTTLILLFFFVIYVLMKLEIKIKLYKFDSLLFKEILIFSSALLLQTIVNQVNNNVGKTILGIFSDPSAVTIYSIAVQVFSIFSLLSTSAISIYLPRFTAMIAKDASMKELGQATILPSRIQTVVSGVILFGFLVCGKDFIVLWLDNTYLQAWYIASMTMGVFFLVYINGIIVSVLDALGKRLFRSLLLLAVSIANIAISSILVNKIGIMGIAIGNAATTFIGSFLIMNIYYKKKIGLDVIYLFRKTLSGILPSLIIAFVIALIPSAFIKLGFIGLIAKGGTFIVVFAICMLIFGLNENEKHSIFKSLSKIKR